MTINYNKDLNLKFEIANNHNDSPSLFLWGVDANEKCDGLSVGSINKMIEFLQSQRDTLMASENDKHQTFLFKEGFEMPTVKDSNNGKN